MNLAKIKIVVKKDQDLSALEKDKISKLTRKCFGDPNLEEHSKTIYFSPTLYRLCLCVNNELISYLRLVRRETNYNGKPIGIGGVGGVSTSPKFRGKGYASKLLEKAFKILKKEKMDVGLLQTNPHKGAKLYGKIGFVLINKPYVFRDINGKKITTDPGGVMLAPIANNVIFQEIIESKEILDIGYGDW